MAYPLHFPEKAPKGTKQGAKLPEVSNQGREIGVFLAFSQHPSVVKQIEQDLRRGPLYPFNYEGICKGVFFYASLLFSANFVKISVGKPSRAVAISARACYTNAWNLA